MDFCDLESWTSVNVTTQIPHGNMWFFPTPQKSFRNRLPKNQLFNQGSTLAIHNMNQVNSVLCQGASKIDKNVDLCRFSEINRSWFRNRGCCRNLQQVLLGAWGVRESRRCCHVTQRIGSGKIHLRCGLRQFAENRFEKLVNFRYCKLRRFAEKNRYFSRKNNDK